MRKITELLGISTENSESQRNWEHSLGHGSWGAPN